MACRKIIVRGLGLVLLGFVRRLMAEPPDGIATGLGVLNAFYLFVFWLQAWVK